MPQPPDHAPEPGPPVAPPYPPSWLDTLVRWVQTVPGPSWLLYAAAIAVFALLNNAVFWIDGSLAPWTFLPVRGIDAGLSVLPIALYHYLSLTAERSFAAFRPILRDPASDLPPFGYRLTRLPRRLGWLALVAGSGLAVSGIRANPATVGLDVVSTRLPVIYQNLALSMNLAGMRRRLRDEQGRLLGEANSRIQRTIDRIHEQVDAGRHDEVGKLRTSLGTLTDERQLLQGLSTWPWDPDTLRGFASSLLLPIILWLVTRLLGRLI